MRKPELGTREWVDHVFGSEPARNPSGRSRPTQRYGLLGPDGKKTVAEGGNCAVARSLLMTMSSAGVVSRLKLEPFALKRGEFGIDAIPDILFETTDERVFVVETKASKHLNAKKLEKCRSVETVIRNARLTYLLWTDAWPLTPTVWSQIREMRRLGTSQVEAECLSNVVRAVEAGPRTFAQLRDAGIYRPHVLSAAWRGTVHLDLLSKFSDSTVISLDVRARKFEDLLSAPVDAHTWWTNLNRAA